MSFIEKSLEEERVATGEYTRETIDLEWNVGKIVSLYFSDS